MAFNIPQTEYDVNFAGLGYTPRQINENTLRKMSDIINKSASNWIVRECACYIIKDVPAKDEWAEAEAIFHYVQNHSHYVKDPQNMEMVQTPLVAIDKWSKGIVFTGDCDDYSVLIGSLLKSIGYCYDLRVASYNPSQAFEHVYGLVSLYGECYPIDGIQEGVTVGWENEYATAIQDWDVETKNWIEGE